MASDLNKVILIARLTRDAELKFTNGGQPVCKFSVAVNRRKKQGDDWTDEASFFDVTLWGKSAESLAKYLTKGKQVGIEGELHQDRWEDKEGGKRSKVEIVAQSVQLLGGKGDAEPGHDSGRQASGGPAGDPDDIPFSPCV